MPPTRAFFPRLIAEPPHEGLPYGRWADTLAGHFWSAVDALETDEDLGEHGEIQWYPDRTYGGRTYVPAVAPTGDGAELFGYVCFAPAQDGADPTDFDARAEFTRDTAADNPDWKLDLNDEVIGAWRGEGGQAGEVELIWGRPLTGGGAIVTAELDGELTDQCALLEERFALITIDAFGEGGGEVVEIALWNARGKELARESLYDDEEEEPEEESAEAAEA